MKPTLTVELAWAAAKDLANRLMRDAGRTSWTVEDYNAACAELERLLPAEPLGADDRLVPAA